MEEFFNNIRDLQDNVADCVAQFVCDNPEFENYSFQFKVEVENGYVQIAEVSFSNNEI